MNDVTQILMQVEAGEALAADRLFEAVYTELRQMAAGQMTREQPGQTLQPTALVHEAWLRLMKPAINTSSSQALLYRGDRPNLQSVKTGERRRYFFAAAAEAMRRILVERYRQKHSLKHGAGWVQQPVEDVAAVKSPGHVLQVHESLESLQEIDPVAAQLVKLRYFAGCTQSEAAEILGLPLRSADRLWAFARAWLYRELSEDSQ